jgi:RNA polymerase sigma-70 factor (ECF subfamily)
MASEEWQLIEEAKNGNERSFEALILSCKKKAWNIAFQYMRNENDAMDALQESFIKIYKNLKNFKGDSRFDTWVHRITVNTCKDMLRKNEKYKLNDSLYPGGEDGEFMREFPDVEPGPEDAFMRSELASELLRCVDRLPPDHRDVIILRDMRNLSYEEISDILDTSLGTVKSRINRARGNLRRMWLEQKSREDV